MKRMKLLFTLALPVLLLQNAQAQTGSRLISQSHWSNNSTFFVPVDSTAYRYDDMARGGDLTHQLKYDESNTWLVTDSVASKKSVQEFYSNNAVKNTSNLSMNSIGGWDNVNRFNYFYNGDGTTSNMVYQTGSGSVWNNYSKNVYGYSGGHLITDKYYMWTGVDFSTFVSQKVYQYDGGTGMMTLETDANNGSAGLTYTQQYAYDYDTANRLATSTYTVWNGSSFVNSSRYSYAYDAAGNRITSTYQVYNSSTGAWDNTTLKTYSGFTAGHNPTNEIDQKWDTTGGGFWYNWMQYDYTYNTHEQLTSLMGISWNTAGFWQHVNGDPMAMYRYGSSFGTAVSTISRENGVVNIFPVPVQNTVSIDLKWNEAQAFTVSIFDITGKVVNSWSVPSTAAYTTSFATDNYPAGNYIVKVAGSKGQITKEIVVAH